MKTETTAPSVAQLTERVLRFTYAGDFYEVNERGHIKANGLPTHSPNWIFKGGSRNHMRRGVDITLSHAFRDPSALEGCYGWDMDHGTTRSWRSQVSGKTARIHGVYVSTLSPEARA
jgi:hypothetical protein